jgi:hypothetical protein
VGQGVAVGHGRWVGYGVCVGYGACVGAGAAGVQAVIKKITIAVVKTIRNVFIFLLLSWVNMIRNSENQLFFYVFLKS